MNTLPIDVIVPVYRGLDETRRCIESVLAARQQAPFELIVINDAGPDAGLTAWLRQMAAEGRLTLLENEHNLGFVLTVNRGMGLHGDRDVVLLNSDTEVANDWLDRLVACAARHPSAGTLTPWSNNATICSYPFEGWNGGTPGTLGLAGLDTLISTTLAGRTLEIPTAVGFCMYIRRRCLDETGLFDAERFGRGYGEENDFCRRAAGLGWQNLLAADVFVFHEGGVSFSDERAALQANAMKRLLEAHPDYLDVVMDFIRRDPAAPLRACIDQARQAFGVDEEAHLLAEQGRPQALATLKSLYARRGTARPVQLHISHGWGGGVERWVLDFCKADTTRRNLWLRSRSDRNAAGCGLALFEPAVSPEPLLEWELALPIRSTAPEHPEYARLLEGLIAGFGIRSVLVSSLIGHGLDALTTGLPTAFVLHDLYPFCPALFAHFESSCTSCGNERLAACLRANPLNVFWHNSTAQEWQVLREALGHRVSAPGVTIVAPTRSVRERWAQLLPAVADRPWQHIEHGLALAGPVAHALPRRPDGQRLRFVIPGRLSPQKGLALLEALMPALLPVADVVLLGCGAFGKAFQHLPGVSLVPDYQQHDLASQLEAFQPDAALMLSTLPESFSYTLSEMFAFGLPVIATDHGAFAERIGHRITGLLVAPQPDAVMAAITGLDQDRALLGALRQNVLERPVRLCGEMVEDYHRLLPLDPAEARPAAEGCLDALHAHACLQREAVVTRLARESSAAEARIEQLVRERDAIAALNTGLQQQIGAIHASSSWRLSRPLRAVARLARLLRRSPQDSGTGAPEDTTALPAIRASLSPAERQEIRRRVRGWFHMPDRCRIVLGFGPPAQGGAFLDMVEQGTAQRNDIAFVLGGLGPEHPCWQAATSQLESLVARRKLFFSPSLHDREAFLWAADAYVTTDAAQFGQNRDDITRAGLSVLDGSAVPALP
ncbi:glycosyltransferase [Zoogloea sp.]|uniref:glycosyltransferase n=1 Tax=Zoogloea sp. TaxID=49181 RepID=UPI001416C78C|nr:MAG: glycosyltransferase [Zoogloea sp.]